MANIYKRFESVAAFNDYLTKGETQTAFKGCESSQTKDSDFTGTLSYEIADHLLMYGDKENANKIEKGGVSRERTKIRLNENRRKIFSDVVGFAPHVPNYIAGVPTAMINARTIQQKTKVLNIVYNMSVSGSVSASDMQNVAIKMLSAILRIEASGVRVNLYVCDISERNGQSVGWLLRIKSSGQHLDVLKTAYPLTNPSMLRRHSFRFTEITKGVNSSFANGYGRASQDVAQMIKACGLKTAKVLHYYTMRGLDVAQITKQILEG